MPALLASGVQPVFFLGSFHSVSLFNLSFFFFFFFHFWSANYSPTLYMPLSLALLKRLGSRQIKVDNLDFIAMDCSSWVNTSLDLNIRPHHHHHHHHIPHEEVPKKEVESNFFLSGMKSSVKEEPFHTSGGSLEEELKRVSAENKRLTEMLTEMCENYNSLRRHLAEYMRNNPQKELSSSMSIPSSKKRKPENSFNNNSCNLMGIHANSESCSTDEESCKKPKEDTIKAKISRAYVRTEPSDTSLIVKDGYQWRKYGQKVTRDNPSPRAYFKCSFAPSCPVKKKVQRSVEDQSILVATYQGEHNHPQPSQMETTTSNSSRFVSLGGSVPCSSPSLSSSTAPSTLTFDLTKPKSNSTNTTTTTTKNPKPKLDSPGVPQVLVEQMASSLTKDPNFRAALVAAISGRISHKN
ncbi:putative WRKY transcription factor 40 [Senna tora]|uniref:Putative WRKY transcription factor 40 n=1 Tax=Senna tora TaxID=362788 RepID=A0A835CL95_9FABA|nr:putative WRKY transcription factor 40 [Senna tora]